MMLEFVFRLGVLWELSWAVSNLTLVTILPYRTVNFFDLRMVGPALEIGMEEVAAEYGLIHFTMQYVKMPQLRTCEDMENAVADIASSIYYKSLDGPSPVAAWFGPGCSAAVGILGTLAKQWNLPLFDGTATASVLADKKLYPTLTRLSMDLGRNLQFFKIMMDTFHWSTAVVIHDQNDPIWKAPVAGLDKYFERFRKTINVVRIPITTTTDSLVSYKYALQLMNRTARVALIYAHQKYVRAFMIVAYKIGMTNGQHAYFTYNTFKTSYWGYPYWSLHDDNDEVAREAFKSLFVFTLFSLADTFRSFKEQVYERAALSYNYSFEPDEEINPHVVGYYDALKLYATVLNESHQKIGHVDSFARNGTAVATALKNRTFKSVTGWKMINANGDTEGHFVMKSFNYVLGDFEVAVELALTGTDLFLYKNLSQDWPGGHWPPEEPFCGYLGHNPACRPPDTTTTIIATTTVVCVVIIVISLLTGIMVTRRAAEKYANYNWWRLTAMEVSMSRCMRSVNLNHSIARNRLDAAIQHVERRASVPKTVKYPGTWKENLVFVKRLPNNIRLTSLLLKELKMVRGELNSLNVVRILGLCVDPGMEFIIFEWCHRGSVKQLIESSHKPMEQSLRFSFVSDLIQGMGIIHHTWFKYHGALTSECCLIDSRFTLKITGFALKSLVSAYEKYRQQYSVWCSPEVLRKHVHDTVGWRKADLYSFAIVASEIATDCVPFGCGPFQPKDMWNSEDTINCVKVANTPYFRPEIPLESPANRIRDLLEKCWDENPDQRPSFSAVQGMFKRAVGGDEGSVANTMMRRLELYAQELEDIVHERTKVLLAEQAKAITILHQLLPPEATETIGKTPMFAKEIQPEETQTMKSWKFKDKGVVRHLLRGLVVPGETFFSVTILFSRMYNFDSLYKDMNSKKIILLLDTLAGAVYHMKAHFDIFQVESSSETYVFVSGAPKINGSAHAEQTLRFGLELHSGMTNIITRFDKSEPCLEFGHGVHTGSCMAGVVGSKLPRYLFFGDTVNTASRMQSTGKAGMIQFSEATYAILQKCRNCEKFEWTARGAVDIKGKGTMFTFWLTGFNDVTTDTS